MQVIVAELFGLLGLGLYIISYQIRCPRRTMLLQSPGYLSYGVTYLLHGSPAGALTCLIGSLRDLGTYFLRDSYFYTLLALYAFFIWAGTLASYKAGYDLLPAIATSLGTLALLWRDHFLIFRGVLFLSLTCWLIYGICLTSPTTIAFGVLCLGSNLIGVYRFFQDDPPPDKADE